MVILNIQLLAYKWHWNVIVTGGTVIDQCFNAFVYFCWSNESEFESVWFIF